ncbi:MAG: ankyrin repeat domain-containing protein [Coxiellaceae bacterium]|nr:ankyrin repeat domain-containing protein [Coxiellaceae bacterium]
MRSLSYEIFDTTPGEAVPTICKRLKALPGSVVNIVVADEPALFAGRTTIEVMQIQMALYFTCLTRMINGVSADEAFLRSSAAIELPAGATQIAGYSSERLRKITDWQGGRSTNGELAKGLNNVSYAQSEGVCCGLAKLSINAFLSGHLGDYIERTHALTLLPSIQLPGFLTELRATIKRYKTYAANYISDKAASDPVFVEQLTSRMKTFQGFHTDLQAFLYGVTLIQEPQNHADIFEDERGVAATLTQAHYPAQALIAATEVDSIDQAVKFAETSDAFRQQDLVKSLEILAETLVEDTVTDSKFSMVLGTEDHASALHFNSDSQAWLLQDPNALPGKLFDNTATGRKALVDEIYHLSGLSPAEVIFLEKQLFCKTGQYQAMKTAFSEVEFKLSAYRSEGPENILVRRCAGKNSTNFFDFALKRGLTEASVDKVLAAEVSLDVPRRPNGYTALMAASASGQAVLVDKLLAMGADVDLKTQHGGSAVDYALWRRPVDGEMVKKLLLSSSHVDAAITVGNLTPLMVACAYGYKKTVIELLARGADIDRRRDKPEKVTGQTARALAEHYRQYEIVDILDEAKRNQYRLYDACERGDLAKVRAFILDGDDVNRLQPNGKSAFDLACDIGNPAVVEEFFRSGVALNINRVRADGDTPLMVACKQGNVGVAKLLINAGANIEAQRPNDRFRPLHVACEAGNASMVELLLKKGADRSIKIGIKAPLSLARYTTQSRRIAELLKTCRKEEALTPAPPTCNKTLKRSPNAASLFTVAGSGKRSAHSGRRVVVSKQKQYVGQPQRPPGVRFS